MEECLKSDVERNSALEWVRQQTPIIKSLTDLKPTLEDTLKGLNITAFQNNLKEQQKREDDSTALAIESKRRLAEAEQKINAAVQDDLTKVITER